MIHLASPDIRDEDIARVVSVLKSGQLVQGKEVQQLEQEIGQYIGTSDMLAASNGTATLHMALVALGIGDGDEVIIPAFSYIATANVIELVGAKPIFVDIDLDTYNINTSQIEAAITPRTKAIMPVHEFGLPCDIKKIVSIARKHNLYVIEDAACALGATENGKYVGTFGDFGSFSLHPRKAITSGEGGLLSCINGELAEKISILRNHGVQMLDGKMNFVDAGFNYRLTEMQAAMVISQFQRFPATLKYKCELSEVYSSEIKSQSVCLPITPEGKTHTWQTYHILVDDSVDRDRLIEQLRDNGIGTNYGAQCIPLQSYYQKKYQLDSEALYPNALCGFRKGIALPLYEKLTKEQLAYVAKTINKLI